MSTANNCDLKRLEFHPLTISDQEAVRSVTLAAGRRNCSFTFANLVGWQFRFNTEVCVCHDVVLLRFDLNGHRAYMLCMKGSPDVRLIELLCADAASCQSDLLLMGLEDTVASRLLELFPDKASVEPRRNQYDYIYLRQELAEVKGKKLKAKRNHINKFLADHPDYVYKELSEDCFEECLRLTKRWGNAVCLEFPSYAESVKAEQTCMERVMSHWGDLHMVGGCVYAEGRMVAFSYGSAVTNDTFDVCVEKADRSVDGAFSIINQQFASHLPGQFVYVNREEDMGLEGLRKAKLSYHPHLLLSYNNVLISCN